MTKSKKAKSKIYSFAEFYSMEPADRFGFFCLLKLDNVLAPDPEDYAKVYKEWVAKDDATLSQELADEEFTK